MIIFEENTKKALTDFYIDSIPDIKEHTFSVRFNNKMDRLIRLRKKPYYLWINTAGKRIAVLTLALFIAGTTTVLSIEPIREKALGFLVDICKKYSVIRYNGEADTPKKIEDIYEITYNLEGFSIAYEENTEFLINKIYVKDDTVVDYCQWIKGEYNQYWNTEDIGVEHTKINDLSAIMFTDNHNYSHIVWENNDYIFTLSANIEKDKLLKIAASLKKEK
ncbi:MAG: DUF4367 domain-containing protein [Clostridium sp.]|nr:DUF4367 domain-containing protein [Clostridium sp.]